MEIRARWPDSPPRARLGRRFSGQGPVRTGAWYPCVAAELSRLSREASVSTTPFDAGGRSTRLRTVDVVVGVVETARQRASRPIESRSTRCSRLGRVLARSVGPGCVGVLVSGSERSVALAAGLVGNLLGEPLPLGRLGGFGSVVVRPGLLLIHVSLLPARAFPTPLGGPAAVAVIHQLETAHGAARPTSRVAACISIQVFRVLPLRVDGHGCR
jgi:hypothetical protein